MLGNAADKFFLGQIQERVTAHSSNALSGGMQVPDRERSGTAHVISKATQMPGPQNQVSSAWMPGMGTEPVPAAPPSLTSRGGGSALPGMGGVTIDSSTMMMLAAGAFGAWYFLLRKKAS